MKTLNLTNGQRARLSEIPVLSYQDYSATAIELLEREENHCVNCFAMEREEGFRLICCIADDAAHDIKVFASDVASDANLPAISAKITAMERFEREIAENSGIRFEGHPWMKPLRTASDDYPFYHMEGEELHEVGVGPIHAGVIEPGHFRFICLGEKVLHLEIMLGYQNRGVEKLFLQKKMVSQRAMLAESVAGDSAASHGTAFASLWESLCGFTPSERCMLERMLACELERIAIHTGDLSAICGDVAYQLGNAVYGRLRTPIINFMQKWCGNRLGKNSVRPFVNPYPFTASLEAELKATLDAFERDFAEMSHHIRHFPSVLSRLERTGVVTTKEAVEIGAVGMAAKASGLCRDTRLSHPYLGYEALAHLPVVKHHGDVYSRTQIRMEEVMQSIAYVREIASKLASMAPLTVADNVAAAASFASLKPEPSSFAISLSEGWRGEICHCAVTDESGELALYKVKDPSFHNWMALALAVRNNDISDFPICNKSFNLSYCGHDL